VLTVLAAWTMPGLAAGIPCTQALGAPAAIRGPLKIVETATASVHFPVAPGRAYLIEVEESRKDALVETLDSKNQVIARADHPERRTGTRRTLVTVSGSSSLVVRVTGKERAGEVGTANVRVFDLAALRTRPECFAAFTALARSDADYAAGEAARSTFTTGARDAFLRAVAGYSAAERALTAPENRRLRGETALALAGVEYFDLQEWAKAANWAEAAARALAPDDLYRKARADALLAAAWIEMGATASAGGAVAGSGGSSTELLVRARNSLQRLSRFHLARGERYDAGLQQVTIALTYLDEGRYSECVAASLSSIRLFDSIHETLRRAEAWQNRALCLWGLGRLPEALRWLERSLKDIGPTPYLTIYVGSITNTALANYALGHFDESLRLYDRALHFAEKIQARRDEADCLYGIGVNYYALGDRERARGWLERSLAIRTVDLDGRGRISSLRALATIDAEDRETLEKALAFDREALSLAVAPSAIARIQIQLAAHAAASGLLTEAKAQLDEILSKGVKGDPAIEAEALLQRAVILRKMGRPQDALADIALARPRLHTFGRLMEEFEADLELARVLRLVGKPDEALTAVDRALAHSDAVRLQTANPELRAQLQTPLRPAYDLKLELMRERYERALAAGRQEEAIALAAAAFTTADAARARTLADVSDQKYPRAVRRALAAELDRREKLYVELSARRFALDTRLDRSGSEDPRSRHLIADISELEREVDTVNTTIATRATTTSPRTHSGRGGMSLPTLPADTALVSYWLGSESAYAWVVLRGEIHWVRLPSPVAIATQATAFHHSLTRLVDIPVERRLRDARALYAMIVRPLEPWLSDVGRWLIVPDGALDYVPFAALQARNSTDSFVAMTHDIALTPAAWTLDTNGMHRRSHARRSLLLVADPVYQPDDPRFVASQKSQKSRPAPRSAAENPPDATRGDYQRLPFTGQEAVQIAAQFSPADVDELIGLDATRDRLLSLDWSAYRFIHIATHGVVDAQVPQLSALILGSYGPGGEVADDAVRVADLSVQTLTADVVVLSACETALGKEVRSEGLMGLGSTMLARGARAVVASLWTVPDEIGARLMTDFYRHLLQDSLHPERALGAAMRSVVSRDRSADPALWAAFQVSVAALGPTMPGGGAQTAKIAATTRP
jgi:CHAT domain-containing protein/tetratricopeptide (TPR) repeat protein